MNRYVIITAAVWAAACSPVDGGFGDRGATLRGRVVRAGGDGLEGMRVHVRGTDGREQVATSGPNGAFVLADAPVGSVRLVGHDGRGSGLLVDAALIDGGENDLGELRLRPLSELPSMVTVSGLGLEERVTSLSGDCLYPIFSADHLRAYCLRTIGDSALAYIVELDVTSGAERVLGADEPILVDSVCSRAPLRLEDERVVVGALADQTVAFSLADEYRRHGRLSENGACESGLDAIADQDFLHWMKFFDRVTVSAVSLSTTTTSPKPSPIVVPNSGDRDANPHQVVAVSPTHAAIRLNLHDPMTGPTDETRNAIHIFDLVARTVTVAHPAYATTAGAFVNGELRVLAPSGIAAFDVQGAERSVLSMNLGHPDGLVLWAGDRGATAGIAVLTEIDGVYSPRPWRVDFAAGTLTPYPQWVPAPVPAETLEFVGFGYRGWRKGANGDITLTAVYVASTTNTPGLATLAEYQLRPDGTGSARLFRDVRDDLESGPISRVVSPDGSRTALLTVDPSTGFRQVSEGPVSADLPPQRTFIAGSHTALDYSADGSAVHFFAFDPLSGYIQLFRMSTTELAPPP